MKKVLFFASILSVFAVKAQDCSELFISEYLEGFSNNKALEIYNPTSNTVDMSNYFVVRYSNGNTSPTLQYAVQLRGSLAPHDVQVGVIDLRDPNGTGQTAPVWDTLQAVADQFYCPDYNQSAAFYWNGNDAVVLFKGKIDATMPISAPVSSLQNVQPIDIFGKIGENPGEPTTGGGWTYDGTPVANGGVVVSADHFLVRKSNVKQGVTTNPSVFNPSLQWDSLSFMTVMRDQNGDTIFKPDGITPYQVMNLGTLGNHVCDCGNATSVSETPKHESFDFMIFPNPVENKQLNFMTTDAVKSITIYNSLGQIIKIIPNAKPYMTVNLDVNAGVYIVKAESPSGISLTKKFIVR